MWGSDTSVTYLDQNPINFFSAALTTGPTGSGPRAPSISAFLGPKILSLTMRVKVKTKVFDASPLAIQPFFQTTDYFTSFDMHILICWEGGTIGGKSVFCGALVNKNIK